MNRTDLLDLIHNGESSGVELKRDMEDNRALAKELVAFANLKGGRVLLGVEKNKTVCGLTRIDPGSGTGGTPRTYDRLEEWVMQACRDKIRLEIIPYFEIVRDVEPDKDVAIVEVERGWSVHHVWHDQHRTYYIRVGTLSREASPEELERLFQQRGAFRGIRPRRAGGGVRTTEHESDQHPRRRCPSQGPLGLPRRGGP
jgi:ATP-dependent DNA helicase RecG